MSESADDVMIEKSGLKERKQTAQGVKKSGIKERRKKYILPFLPEKRESSIDVYRAPSTPEISILQYS